MDDARIILKSYAGEDALEFHINLRAAANLWVRSRTAPAVLEGMASAFVPSTFEMLSFCIPVAETRLPVTIHSHIATSKARPNRHHQSPPGLGFIDPLGA